MGMLTPQSEGNQLASPATGRPGFDEPSFRQQYEASLEALAALAESVRPVLATSSGADAATLLDAEMRAYRALEQMRLHESWAILYNALGWTGVSEGTRSLKVDLLALIQRIEAVQAVEQARQAEAIRKSMDEAWAISMEGNRARMKIIQDSATELFNMQNETLKNQRASRDEQHRKYLDYIRGSRY